MNYKRYERKRSWPNFVKMSYGKLRNVASYKLSDVSEVVTVSIIRIIMDEITTSETSVHIFKDTQRNIAVDKSVSCLPRREILVSIDFLLATRNLQNIMWNGARSVSVEVRMSFSLLLSLQGLPLSVSRHNSEWIMALTLRLYYSVVHFGGSKTFILLLSFVLVTFHLFRSFFRSCL